MATKQATTLYQSHPSSRPNHFHGEPLQLVEMLTLIKIADELGYSIKAARDTKSLYDVVSSDLYSVWFAIENELPLFAHNIFDLIKFTEWERHMSSAFENDINVNMATAS